MIRVGVGVRAEVYVRLRVGLGWGEVFLLVISQNNKFTDQPKAHTDDCFLKVLHETAGKRLKS